MGKPAEDLRAYIALGIIISSALAFSLFFLYGSTPTPYGGDDSIYLNYAYTAATGRFSEMGFLALGGSPIFGIRLMQVLPIALFFKLFGAGIFSGAMWDILSFLGSIAATFLIGKELYGNKAGLFSALLLSLFPLVVSRASTVNDNITMMFLTTLAMLCFVYGLKRSSRGWYAACGALLSASITTTPEALITSLVLAIYILFSFVRTKRLPRGTACIAYGFAATLLLISIFNYANVGSPFLTLSLNNEFYGTTGPMHVSVTPSGFNLLEYPTAMFQYGAAAVYKITNPVAAMPQMYLSNLIPTGFYFYALIPFIVYLVVVREKRAYFPIFWFLATFLYLEAGPMHIGVAPLSYIPMFKMLRFLILAAAPVTLIIGMALHRLLDDKGYPKAYRLAAVSAIIAFLAVTSVPLSVMWYYTIYYLNYNQISIAGYLGSLPNSTQIYSTGFFDNVLPYMGYANISRFHPTLLNCTGTRPVGYIIAIGQQYASQGVLKLPGCPAADMIPMPMHPNYIPIMGTILNYSNNLNVTLPYIPNNATSVREINQEPMYLYRFGNATNG
ncbi:MAG: glycosyltransferase family 39 protein [Candidatus Micrarchaeota archaeon]|nr:glycosyltransferase family 39 protein [Candidatus Micrarchaeota archaeon]